MEQGVVGGLVAHIKSSEVGFELSSQDFQCGGLANAVGTH